MEMPVEVSAFPYPTQGAPAEAMVRHFADFPPDVWGDYFLHFDPGSDTMASACHSTEGTVQKLIGEVGQMLMGEAGDVLEKLELIDQVQRLGLAYHFEKEIGEQLAKLNDVYPDYVNGRNNGSKQLHAEALFFRLLRQQGCRVSSEVFAKFKDDCGMFGEMVNGDVRGILSLYEASYMMVHSEDILQEALDFTTTYLKSIDEGQHSPYLVNMIRKALCRPIRKEIPRLQTWHYIQTYQSDPSHNQVLLSLAKLDFNLLQKMHRQELSEIVRWWKDWDFAKKTPFVRDRLVESYLWVYGVYFEPEFSFARKFLTKITAILTVMDDLYDAYGTWKELVAYTEAFQKWDKVAAEGLPDHMQLLYGAYLAAYQEVETELARQGQLYRLPYGIQATKDQAKWYLAEAKWFNEKYTPLLDDEYIVQGSLSTGYTMLITNSLVGMGSEVTEETFKWLSDSPLMLTANTLICRLMDDIVSYKFERKRDHIPSAVECYVKQYGGTEEEAEEALRKRVFEAWKDINESFLQPFAVPESVLTRMLNFARVMDVLYKDEDHFTNSGNMTKRIISYLLVDPLPM